MSLYNQSVNLTQPATCLFGVASPLYPKKPLHRPCKLPQRYAINEVGRNKLKHIVILTIALFFSVNTYSGEFNNCGVEEIRLGENDRNAHVKLTCNVATEAQCATAKRFVAFDRSTESGNQKLSIFLTAFAAGSKVTGNTLETCPDFQGNVVELNWLVISHTDI
ncbi:hypothetical protein P886_3414 [Alteromonadaceae bacterium 2753L.S.0a.02]|nr:hypothetical protein P886_3414 [Alteromonadaceae bacterium 2753L.S.0a.02]